MSDERSSDEIRADLALGMADDDFDAATDRLVGDVSPLLAEVEGLRDLVAEFRKRDASQDRVRELLTAERDDARAEVRSLRGVVQAQRAREMTVLQRLRDRHLNCCQRPVAAHERECADVVEIDWRVAEILAPWSDPEHDVAADLREASDGGWPLRVDPRKECGCDECQEAERYAAALAAAADAPQPDDLPTCEHGHTVSHYIDSKTAQYHQLDNICPGPSPAVLPQPRKDAATAAADMCPRCHRDNADAYALCEACAVSGVAGNPDEAGEK